MGFEAFQNEMNYDSSKANTIGIKRSQAFLKRIGNTAYVGAKQK